MQPPSQLTCNRRLRASLSRSLRECSGHFIRCIKPNATKAPWTFDPNVAATQLLACGVLAAALVSRTGYPDRPTFDTFLKKYKPAGLLAPRPNRGGGICHLRRIHGARARRTRRPCSNAVALVYIF